MTAEKGTRLIIAVDGPAGSGKGSVCRSVADRFGLAYLETGAIYRAVGLIALEQGLDAPESLAEAAAEMPFTFRALGGGNYGAFLGEREISDDLRREEVGERASQVSAIPDVRQALLGFQRGYGGSDDAILDGRDVGTVVCPDAGLKIFLTASLEARAERRALELQAKGEPVSLREVSARMAARDARDSGRSHAPLKPAEDAVIVDTTPMTKSESIERVAALISQKISNR
ncbi:MAG: (d)CMP kinase [Magnetococcales bacterium]|nr:(d)CMP kinase [Magnetococcales bacterium]